jgi:uncharacterized membrane protein YbjE (DUF340 family)
MHSATVKIKIIEVFVLLIYFVANSIIIFFITETILRRNFKRSCAITCGVFGWYSGRSMIDLKYIEMILNYVVLSQESLHVQ